MLRSKAFTTFLFLTPMVLFLFILHVFQIDKSYEDENAISIEDLENLEKLKYLADDKKNTQVNYSVEKNLKTTGFSEVNEMYLVKNEAQSFPTIFIITPTYFRPTQMPDLTRLAQTLMLVKNLMWIVVEDSKVFNKQVRDLLIRSKIPYAHLLGPRPPTHLDLRSGRGVSNRLKALEWLRQKYTNTNKQGVFYFADDDNSYDIRVFEEMRYTKKVSVFPVGMLAKTGISTPIVKNGKVVGFHDPWFGNRVFAIDMAGFATNLQYFLSKPKATMPYKVGYEEDYFLKSLEAELSDLEPKAKNCTEVYVWHTKTQMNPFPSYSNIRDKNSTNLPILYYNILNTKL